MIKISEKTKRSNEEDKKLAEFIQRAKQIATVFRHHLQGPTMVRPRHFLSDYLMIAFNGRNPDVVTQTRRESAGSNTRK